MDRFLLLRQYDAAGDCVHFALIASFKRKHDAIKYAKNLGGSFRLVDDDTREAVKEWTIR